MSLQADLSLLPAADLATIAEVLSLAKRLQYLGQSGAFLAEVLATMTAANAAGLAEPAEILAPVLAKWGDGFTIGNRHLRKLL